MTKQHAYLIICHNHFRQLGVLLSLLDDERNDIYLHVDKKSGDFPKSFLQKQLKRSRLFYVERLNVHWGGYSQIRTEMILLETAIKNKTEYAYYHLLSGVDLPIKSQDEIHRFFDENMGGEFLSFSIKDNQTKEFLDKISLYYFFQDKVGRNGGFLSTIENLSTSLQRRLSVDRLGDKRSLFYKGTNWFSITDGLARFITAPKQQAFIERYMKYTCCADEIFLQTIGMNSPYRENITNTSMRLIDWKRGNPYTFTIEDYDLIMASDCLFARKFDESKDAKIIRKIAAAVKKNSAN